MAEGGGRKENKDTTSLILKIMTAKFEIIIAFAMSARNYFVLGGNILEGTIVTGMHIITDDKKIPVSVVETIDFKNNSLLGLLIECKDKEEKIEYEKLFKDKKEIEIIDSLKKR